MYNCVILAFNLKKAPMLYIGDTKDMSFPLKRELTTKLIFY